MSQPAIYSLIGVPVLGELGPRSEVEQFPECGVCGRARPEEIRFIEYVFDYWSGEDLIAVAGYDYAVTARLREELERAEIRGAEFERMDVVGGEGFEIVPPANVDALPPFFRLSIVGRASGPEVWWKSETCPACGVTSWSPLPEGIQAQTADLTGEPAPPRQVYRSSWQGDDIFRLEDPGPPVVTQRFADVLDRVGVGGVRLHPAEWMGSA